MNPVAFSLFGIEVRWYGILIAVGVCFAMIIGDYLVKRSEGLYEDIFTDFVLWALPMGILGARIYYVLFSWDYYSAHPGEIFAIRNGGLAIHGGVILGVLTGIIFCKVKKVSFLELADVTAPGLVLAQGIGRWGNFINGEAHGGPTNLPWAITVDGIKVHPTFLYESIWDVAIFLFLFFYLFKRKKYHGQVFFAYGILYSIGRFFIEGLRTDSLMLGSLRVAQVVSLLTIFLFLVLGYLKKNGKLETNKTRPKNPNS